jgi:hypothetical protein
MSQAAILHNDHHGRMQLATVRGELVWLFVPYEAAP